MLFVPPSGGGMESSMSDKKRQAVSAAGFLAVFGVLLALATRFDLDVSHMLADRNLVASRYFSTSLLCNLVEIAGMAPIWVAATFAASVLTVYFHCKKGGLRHLRGFFFVLTVAVSALLLRDMLKYSLMIGGREELLNAPWMIAVLLAFGLTVSSLILKLAGERIRQNMGLLLPFALAIVCACCCHLWIEVIKNPMGRMRYRAMHLIDDYSWFTPWYRPGSARELLAGQGLLWDYFKSFPSGHTYAASMSYLLILFPDLFRNWKTGRRKVLSYVIPVAYTGFVAFFRIAAGAHFFSDVLVGGTMGFVAVQVFRYIFLYRLRAKIEKCGMKAAA